MLAPLRYVISMSKRSKLTIIAIGVVIMFLTSTISVIYSFEMSNRELTQRFQSKYYVISSHPNILKSSVPLNMVSGAYVVLLPVNVDNISTFAVGIYDPYGILKKNYNCSQGEIILGTQFKATNGNVVLQIGENKTMLHVRRKMELDIFPNYWVIINFTEALRISKKVNFVITDKLMHITGYYTTSMIQLNNFYTRNVEEISWDLMFLEIIGILVIYIFTNTLLNLEIMENVRKISIIKAMGSSRSNLIGLYLLRSLYIGLSGMVIGFSLGVIVTYFMVSFLPLLGIVSYFNIYIPPTVFVINTLIALVGAVLASLGPIRRAVKIEVIQGIRGMEAET